MRVTTAVSLMTGAAVGFLFGMGVDDKTKEKIASCVKRKMFYALTGEKMPEKKPIGKVYYDRYRKEEIKMPFDWEEMKKKMFEFKSVSQAHGFIARMNELARNFKTVSIYEVCCDRDLPYLNYYFDYGWDENETDEWDVLEKLNIDGTKRYYVTVNKPHFLRYCK